MVTEVILVDRNDLNGTMFDVCELDSINVVGADCEEVSCGCCDLCCTDGIGDLNCHDLDVISSVSPAWETGYTRSFFQFSDADDATQFDLIASGGDSSP